MSGSIYLAIPLFAFLAVMQSSALSHFPVAGYPIQLLILLSLSWGLLTNLQEGITWAFIAGIFLDLFSLTPIGISAFALMGAVAVSIFWNRRIPTSRVLAPMFFAAVTTAVYFLIYGILLQLAGFTLPLNFINLVGAHILIHAIAILPVYWLTFASVNSFMRQSLHS